LPIMILAHTVNLPSLSLAGLLDLSLVFGYGFSPDALQEKSHDFLSGKLVSSEDHLTAEVEAGAALDTGPESTVNCQFLLCGDMFTYYDF
ncbi:hypothetical protein STEG23_032214, partial [Scotinomys teguina]